MRTRGTRRKQRGDSAEESADEAPAPTRAEQAEASDGSDASSDDEAPEAVTSSSAREDAVGRREAAKAAKEAAEARAREQRQQRAALYAQRAERNREKRQQELRQQQLDPALLAALDSSNADSAARAAGGDAEPPAKRQTLPRHTGVLTTFADPTKARVVKKTSALTVVRSAAIPVLDALESALPSTALAFERSARLGRQPRVRATLLQPGTRGKPSRLFATA